MRKVILQMSISIDGFVGGPNGENDWLLGNFDQEATAWIANCLWQAGVHVMGRRTYCDMAAYWPSSTEPLAAPMNEIPKVVFSSRKSAERPSEESTTTALRDAIHMRTAAGLQPSHTLPPSAGSWAEVTMARGDLTEEITRLKQQAGKDILAHGGAQFARSLTALGLVDEYRLLIHPVALGNGLPLFSGLSKPARLTLLNQVPFASGVVAHVYQPV